MTQEQIEQLEQIIADRANEMLQHPGINIFYQSFETESEAKDWLLKSAIATLILSAHERP